MRRGSGACLSNIAEEGVGDVSAPEGADEVLENDLGLGNGFLEPGCRQESVGVRTLLKPEGGFWIREAYTCGFPV
jgi:hypothetical protein